MPSSNAWHTPAIDIFTWENALTNISSIWDIFQLSSCSILFPPHSQHCRIEKAEIFNFGNQTGKVRLWKSTLSPLNTPHLHFSLPFIMETRFTHLFCFMYLLSKGDNQGKIYCISWLLYGLSWSTFLLTYKLWRTDRMKSNGSVATKLGFHKYYSLEMDGKKRFAWLPWVLFLL